jgi:hypothetical protein
MLTPREIEVLAATFVDGDTNAGLAERLGCTRQSVHRSITAGLRKLKAAGLPAPCPRPTQKGGLIYMTPGDLDGLAGRKVSCDA